MHGGGRIGEPGCEEGWITEKAFTRAQLMGDSVSQTNTLAYHEVKRWV